MSEHDHDEPSGRPTRRSGKPPALDAVEARLRELRKGKQRNIRWTMSRQTAEMAISAFIEAPAPRPARSSKSRRRKRAKRLL